MTTTPAKERITETMLDQMLEDEDLPELFHSGELFIELRRKLAERILNAEMDVHLSQPEERLAGNTRNGHNSKTVITDSGTMPLEVPRDRQGTFEPQLVEKYCRRLPGFDNKVIHLFSHGMSTRRIRETVRELYGVEVSADLISRVTGRRYGGIRGMGRAGRYKTFTPSCIWTLFMSRYETLGR